MRVLIFFLLLTANTSAQEYLDPINTNSFGLNNHTNRDISYFTLVDSNDNIVNIATTERDSTYTDILISKFDSDLNLTWQKRHSIDTGLSYDIPLDLYIDSSNNIILVGRSSFRASVGNGLLFILKYNPQGNLLWEKTIGNIDGSDYYDYNHSSYSASFEDGKLKISYAKLDWGLNSPIHHITIDEAGNISEVINVDFPNDGSITTYKNGIYYTLARVNDDDGNFYNQFYLIKKTEANEDIFHLNYLENFIYENFTQVLEYYKLQVDDQGNIFLIKTKVEGEGTLTNTKINKDGEIVFSKQFNENYNYIGSYFDEANSLNLVIYNHSNLSVLKVLIDNSGQDNIIHEVESTNYIGADLKDESTLFVANSQHEINLYDQDLNFINSFKFSNYYELSDIAKIDNSNIVTSGTSYDKMYPESDFLAQRNIILEKIDTIEINKNYIFSGEGTSRALRPMVSVDNDNNYIVFSEEKMGPDNNNIGGSRGPLNKSIYKFDSNFNLLWRVEIPNLIFTQSNWLIDSNNNIYVNSRIENYNNEYELYKISPTGEIIYNVPSFNGRNMHFDKDYNINIVSSPIHNNVTFDDDTHIYTLNSNNGALLNTTILEGTEVLRSYNAPDGNAYIFLYTGRNTPNDRDSKLKVFKNLHLIFTIDFHMPEAYGDIIAHSEASAIDNNGSFFFSSAWGSNDNRIHKVTLDGNYQFLDIDSNLNRLKVLENGNVFVIQKIRGQSDFGKVKLFDNNLNEILTYNNTFYNYSIVLEINELILLNSYYDNLVKVVNQNGQLIDEFKLISNLSYCKIDKNNELVLTGTFGNQIYLYSYYGWYRGLLHKYRYDGPIDSDGDGIGDNVDECPDTPSGEPINETGCSQSQIDDDNDGVMNDKDECTETPNGESVDEKGCSQSQLDDDNDGVMNNVDECPNSPIPNLVDEKGCFYLPANNFTIETLTETCPDKNNGQINISAIEALDYVVSINGATHSFNSDLTINDLAPGSYEICITVPLVSYEQCFNVILEEGTEVSASSSIESNILYIDMAGGTLPYNVIKNGEEVFQTRSTSFSLLVKHGDNIVVKTNKDCEGSFNKNINLTNSFILYPNPTTSLVEINLPILSINQFKIDVFNAHSQLMFTSFHSNNGKATLDLKNMPSGVYFAKINLNEPVILKIVKQ